LRRFCRFFDFVGFVICRFALLRNELLDTTREGQRQAVTKTSITTSSTCSGTRRSA
jgi:hypothetical protein